jgi:hypothetical protein
MPETNQSKYHNLVFITLHCTYDVLQVNSKTVQQDLSYLAGPGGAHSSKLAIFRLLPVHASAISVSALTIRHAASNGQELGPPFPSAAWPEVTRVLLLAVPQVVPSESDWMLRDVAPAALVCFSGCLSRSRLAALPTIPDVI